MQTAKVFKHGNSQAVRLPKEFRFEGTEVHIRRTPAGVLLISKKTTPEQVDAVLAQFGGRFVRRQPALQKRSWR
jgi:antitoxin VapB